MTKTKEIRYERVVEGGSYSPSMIMIIMTVFLFIFAFTESDKTAAIAFGIVAGMLVGATITVIIYIASSRKVYWRRMK